MSFQPPPPQPPTKSTYGDTELSDDGWSQHSGPPKFTNYPQGNMGGQAIQPAFNQGLGSRYAPGNIQQIGQGQARPPVPDLTTLASTMTQDDILFMRKVRTDCFFYRVIPLTATSCGILYMYNKSKELPNRIGRFVGLGFCSLFLGISTYRGKFRQMIAESRSNSPYMQALKQSFGLPLMTEFSGDNNVEYGSKIDDGSTNWNSTELSGDLRFTEKPDDLSASQFYTDNSYQPLDSGNQEVPKPAATYEELRSRNRGYSR